MFAFRHGACPKSTHTIFLSFLFFLILRIMRPPPNAVQTRPTVIWDRVCVCYHQPRPGRLWSDDCCTNCCIHTKEKIDNKRLTDKTKRGSDVGLQWIKSGWFCLFFQGALCAGYEFRREEGAPDIHGQKVFVLEMCIHSSAETWNSRRHSK